MSERNQTSVKELVLLPFEGPHRLQILLFPPLLIIYLTSLGGNVLIILLVSITPRLHSPMYFFLSHLSLTDIIIISNVVPSMLYFILQRRGTILFTSCIIQLFVFGVSTDIQCLLLTVMSYDRYLAICHPLRYTSIMDIRLQFYLVTGCWLLGLLEVFVVIGIILTLQFCGPNILNHFFCDLGPVLDLSCSDTSVVETEVFVAGILALFCACVFIIVTYVCIFLTVLGSSITTGKHKAFSTCISHLIVVCMYYATLFTNYMVPMSDQTLNLKKYISLLYTVMTPFLNPIIYTLRNQEIRATLSLCAKSVGQFK